MSPPFLRSRFALGVLVCAALQGILTVRLMWPHVPVDDAFITFRYADNLARGEGLVFNPGQRVEGYTSLAWLLVLAAADAAGISVIATSKLLGLLLGLGTLGLVASHPFDRPTRLWAAALFATHLPVLYHFSNGLETAAATFLVTALVCASPARRRERFLLYGAASTLTLTRPEGALAVLVFAATHGIVARNGNGRFLVRITAAALVTAGAQLLFRWSYYGELVANSVRAKMMPLDFAWPHGLLDVGRFFGQAHGSPLLAALAILALVRASADRVGGRRTVALGTFLGTFAIVLAVGGGDSFPLWRFFVPLAPAFFLLSARGLVGLARSAAGVGAFLGPGAHAVLFGALLFSARAQSPGMMASIEDEGAWKEHWTRLGHALARAFDSRTSIALCPVGALPYASRLVVVDMLGLTNPVVARAPVDRSYFYPGHQRHDASAILDLEPDLLMLANGPLASSTEDPFPWPSVRIYEKDVLEDPRFRRDYLLIGLPVGPGEVVQLFGRKSLLAGRRAVPPLSREEAGARR